MSDMRKSAIRILCAAWVCGAALSGCAGGSGQSGSQSVPTETAGGMSGAASREMSAEASEAAAGEAGLNGGGAEESARSGQAAQSEAGAAEAAQKLEKTGAEEAAFPALEDGVYTAEFDTDSSMFRVNEACDGRGTLTVENGAMTIHISLGSKNIVNLYPGLAEDARKDGAQVLEPTVDPVTYSDGFTEEVYGFDVPVPVLDEEFDLALIGKKGKWYDHKVRVSDPVPVEDGSEEPGQTGAAAENAGGVPVQLDDGEYLVEVALEGGTGRAGIDSPAELTVRDGQAAARIVWSSPNYDYMKLGEETYLPVNTEGNSVFEIPVEAFDVPVPVTADTVAMGTPHEIDYTLVFDGASVRLQQE